MILTDIIKIHQDFIIIWLGLDMHDFATNILKCIDTCIWWLLNFVCVWQSSHSVYIFSVSCFFFIIIWFPVLCPYSTCTQVVCQIDICSLKTIINQLTIITFCVYFFYFMLHPLKTFFNVCFRLRCVMPSCPTFREYVDLINVFKWVI